MSPFPGSVRRNPLLVGEANSYGSNPSLALYPLPANSAGGRLCRRILGLRPGEYLRRFERVNLSTGPGWSIPRARRAAEGLIVREAIAVREGGALPRPVVLLGARVCTAFGVPYAPLVPRESQVWSVILPLPHPSGRCRFWNEPGAFERARDLLVLSGVLESAP